MNYFYLFFIDFKRNLKAALPNPFNKYSPLIIHNF